MKKTLKKIIVNSLRFHHQDIHSEVEFLKAKIAVLEGKIDAILTILSQS